MKGGHARNDWTMKGGHTRNKEKEGDQEDDERKVMSLGNFSPNTQCGWH